MLLFFITIYSCTGETNTIPSVYKYIEPQYNDIKLAVTGDTIHFILNDHTFNAIRSFNVFSQNRHDYISFYDERSQTINIYDFQTRHLIKKIRLKKCLKTKSFYKTSVYSKNFDSIFVNNVNKLYLLDSAGAVLKTIDFVKKSNYIWAVFENTNPLVVKDNQIYASVRPYVDETSIKALKKWKVLYKFDFENDRSVLLYNLPKMYQENLYGYHFLDYNYCFNNRGNFVFSFPADSTVYETNLRDYHVAFYAKSRFQTSDISPVNKEDLKGGDLGYRQYKLRDSYGPIFFDPFKKRYLRLAKQKMNEADIQAKKKERKESIIIFNEDLKIIGESELPDDFAFATLFFSPNGNMYARINAKDEYALHFVRLEYTPLDIKPDQLTKADINLVK
jgi:hypothetical protein